MNDERNHFPYADIIVDISHESVDRPFTYRIPRALQGKLQTGMSVLVPFGKGDRKRQGYIIAFRDGVSFDESKVKEIEGITDDDMAVDAILVRLAGWIRKQYGSTMITALKTVLPAKLKKRNLEKREICRLLSAEETEELAKRLAEKNRPAMARLLFALTEKERLPMELVKEKLHISPSTINSLEKQGALKVESVRIYRNPVISSMETAERKDAFGKDRPKLSDAQQGIVDSVLRDYDAGIRKTYLIHGITGSGKTEVYMHLIEGCLKRGRQAILLIPEIALTYQTVIRFLKRFGNRVSVLHSGLSAGEKYDQCERAKNGDIDVIIGPRSALFTPFRSVGLIIIDEEHEPSYKSETMPKYHARETAIYLASLHQASVVLGSATPSLESYYRAKHGEYGFFYLGERLTGNVLPEVYPVDLRQELREGNRSIFSRKLQELIEDRLEKREQVMLFLNRRGLAGFVSCRNCGHVMKCPHCSVSLSEHKAGKLVCHYCGHEEPSVKVCPSCGSRYILGFRAGTEAVEEKLHQMYPRARVLRMDGDTTKKKDSYEKILSAFADREADILLGTQMIVKGHDFPAVTLVGILAADMSLFAGDHRAAERTFQLLTQAAGRAGRGDRAGEVVIQSYQPDHYSIVHAAAQDYVGFYEEEILYREIGMYPPAAHMMAVLVTGPEEREAEYLAEELAKLSKKDAERDLTVLGPGTASLSKLNDNYRFIFYLKSSDENKLAQAREHMESYIQTLQKRSEQVQFDIDPMNGY
ncbi:MAG: primosomal protein N' [Lachnospiraceae bacterium]|nr:primosomal protein N' [Lachnospiraceae bacterium]